MLKSKIMDETAFDRAITRISHEILEKNADETELCLLGILRRGAPLAQQIAKNLCSFSSLQINIGTLDITFYRDDLSKDFETPHVNSAKIDFSVENKTVILVDDVLYTGRTARAAIEAVLALGRPKCIQLAVLIDRGHRELPIRGDFVGKNIPTSRKELVAVRLPEYDDTKEVVILEP